MKKQSGITLIALIITIVVMLILSAVTISLTLGERGIFNTAQKAGKNYKEASEKEISDLTNLEKEMQSAINRTGNGGTTPEQKPVKLNTVTSANYGDYVDYPISIGRGPAGIAETHKTDWRIFYNDGTYVYLISSYLLENSKVPTGIGMNPAEGRPYTTYWGTDPTQYTQIAEDVRVNYKMSWNKSTTNSNIKCVSELLDITKWSTFVNTTYALDAIGSPTLEMWIESWNHVEKTQLYCNNSNENGYYVGTSSEQTTTEVSGLSTSNSLYFPVTNDTASDTNGYRYWLASSSAKYPYYLMDIYCGGFVINDHYCSNNVSVRPIVRLKADVMAKQDTQGVWILQ